MRTRRSLIDLDDLSGDEIETIFEQTRSFEGHAPGRLLEGVDAVNLFLSKARERLRPSTLHKCGWVPMSSTFPPRS